MQPVPVLAKGEEKATLEITLAQFQNLQWLLARAREAKTVADSAQLVQQCASEAYVNTAAAVIADAGGPQIGEKVRIDGLRQSQGKFYIEVSLPGE